MTATNDTPPSSARRPRSFRPHLSLFPRLKDPQEERDVQGAFFDLLGLTPGVDVGCIKGRSADDMGRAVHLIHRGSVPLGVPPGFALPREDERAKANFLEARLVVSLVRGVDVLLSEGLVDGFFDDGVVLSASNPPENMCLRRFVGITVFRAEGVTAKRVWQRFVELCPPLGPRTEGHARS